MLAGELYKIIHSWDDEKFVKIRETAADWLAGRKSFRNVFEHLGEVLEEQIQKEGGGDWWSEKFGKTREAYEDWLAKHPEQEPHEPNYQLRLKTKGNRYLPNVLNSFRGLKHHEDKMPDEITQKDKLDYLKNNELLRKALGSYHSVAVADALDTLGGRYSNAVAKVTVTGSDPRTTVPRQPPDSPANQSLVAGNKEPALGYAINDQEATGEKFEQQRSLNAPSEATGAEPTSPVASATAGGVGRFRRRF
jgi:hypothetical protein